MEIRLLGSVELLNADQRIPLGRPQQRCVLAVLAVAPGQPLAMDQLLARVWGDHLPNGARDVLYSHVSRLRRALEMAGASSGRHLLRRAGGGYVLDINPTLVDLHRARRLAAKARALRGHDDAQAVVLLDEAASLWRAIPLAGLSGDWVERTRAGIAQEHLAVLTDAGATHLQLGRHSAVLGRLTDLCGEHPLNESVAGLLMLALYRCDRVADALRVYGDLRRRLVAEIGDEPGARSRQLYERILRRDPTLDEDKSAGTAERLDKVAKPVPAQLPTDVAGFTGRTDALRLLDELLPPANSSSVISVVVGAAGVGKTALAVHWAHQVSDRFPDGQLYMNLHGFDATTSAVEPAVVIRGFLDAFAVPTQRIPTSVESQAALYRSLLSGRRMLVILDNARDAEQVRPLLPGAPQCRVIVTSRDQLAGLVAAQSARPVVLGLLAPTEARHMLARRLGAGRVAAEPEAVAEIISMCGQLPLALAIVAARASTNPHVPIAALVTELHQVHARLDAFASPDPATDVRAVFSWSCRALSEAATRMFRLLSLHPGPDVAVSAAASLAATTRHQARRLLTELIATHLVTDDGTHRYSMHDLLRAYATELVNAEETAEERLAAMRRMFDHYLRTAHNAALLLQPHRAPISLPTAASGVVHEHFAAEAAARAWFAEEYPVLLAAIRHAAASGFDSHTWQMAGTLVDHCDREGLWHDQVTVQRIALHTARQSTDLAAQAHAHHDLGSAYARLALLEDAVPHLQYALDLFIEVGDQTSQAHTHLRMAWVCHRLGRHKEVVHHDQRALDLYRATGERAGQGGALNNIGWMHSLLGDHKQAVDYCRQALAVHQETGDRAGEANTWDSLGFAFDGLSRHDEARVCYQRGVALFQQIGDRYFEANTLTHLGNCHLAVGDADAAFGSWRHALTIFDELDHPDANEVRAKLDQLART